MHLGTSLGGVWEVDSELILGPFLDPIWTISEKPHKLVNIPLHLAVGRAFRLNMTKYGSLEQCWWVPGIAPLPAHPYPHPGYTPSPHRHG